MKKYPLKNFTRGWIIGNFTPSIIRTKDFEFCVKNYESGDIEETHMHKVATEVSVIVTGEFEMNKKRLKKGEILVMKPKEVGNFRCIKTGSIAVIKTPSVKGDKYIISK